MDLRLLPSGQHPAFGPPLSAPSLHHAALEVSTPMYHDQNDVYSTNGHFFAQTSSFSDAFSVALDSQNLHHIHQQNHHWPCESPNSDPTTPKTFCIPCTPPNLTLMGSPNPARSATVSYSSSPSSSPAYEAFFSPKHVKFYPPSTHQDFSASQIDHQSFVHETQPETSSEHFQPQNHLTLFSGVSSSSISPSSTNPMKMPKKRNTANKKERKRTVSINTAFSLLRDRIPNVPTDTKLSKIKTLRLATNYISYLMKVLEQSSSPDRCKNGLPMSCEEFKVDLQRFKGIRTENDMNPPRPSPGKDTTMLQAEGSKRSKGRTGWPQHVWALELKREHAET